MSRGQLFLGLGGDAAKGVTEPTHHEGGQTFMRLSGDAEAVKLVVLVNAADGSSVCGGLRRADEFPALAKDLMHHFRYAEPSSLNLRFEIEREMRRKLGVVVFAGVPIVEVADL